MIASIVAAVAAGFAGWAAFSAMAMVQLERDRDKAAAEEQQLRQARLVVVDAVSVPLRSITRRVEAAASSSMAPEGWEKDLPFVGVDVMATVLNAGREPIRDLMVKVTSGDATFGPKELGPLPPGAEFWAAARMFSGADETARVDVYCRFRDAQGQAWQIHNHGGGPERLEPDELEKWRHEARAFDGEPMSDAERGRTSNKRNGLEGIHHLRAASALPVEGWVHSRLVPKPGDHMTEDDNRWHPSMDQAQQALAPISPRPLRMRRLQGRRHRLFPARRRRRD